MVIIIGIMSLLIGFLLKAFPPKKQNAFFGYRTELSRMNEDTWNEAQKYSANCFITMGIIFIPLQFILSNLNVSYDSGIFIVLISILLMIVTIESHLKRIFNEDGSRRL